MNDTFEIYDNLEIVCPLFWRLNPSKSSPFQSKRGSCGFHEFVTNIAVNSTALNVSPFGSAIILIQIQLS